MRNRENARRIQQTALEAFYQEHFVPNWDEAPYKATLNPGISEMYGACKGPKRPRYLNLGAEGVITSWAGDAAKHA
jgi:hypothetical protein